MDRPIDLLLDNTRELARGVVAQMPYIAIALLVFVAFILLARLLRTLVRRGLGRHDPAFAEMVARLAQVAMVALGVFIALWIAIPTVQCGQIFASLGVTGIILGFAQRDIIENFVAGTSSCGGDRSASATRSAPAPTKAA